MQKRERERLREVYRDRKNCRPRQTDWTAEQFSDFAKGRRLRDKKVSISSTFYCVPFSYKSTLRTFSLITVWLNNIFGKRISAQKLLVKCWWNWLREVKGRKGWEREKKGKILRTLQKIDTRQIWINSDFHNEISNFATQFPNQSLTTRFFVAEFPHLHNDNTIFVNFWKGIQFQVFFYVGSIRLID